MNVEAQAIRVPTGLQDYRPALYGGIAALELDVDGIRRVPLDVDDSGTRIAAASSATPASRAIPAPTTGRSPRSTSTATATSSTASSGSATPRRRCATRSRETTGTRSAPPSPRSGTTASGLPPASRLPRSTTSLPGRTRAGATAAKVCGAGGGGCLFCYGPPDRRGAIREALAAGGARLLDFRIERHGLARG